jgi:hypothetical protein
MSTLQEDRDALFAAQNEARQKEVFYTWLAQNPQYRYQACVCAIVDHFAGEPWSLGTLSESAEILRQKGVIHPLDSQRVNEDAQAEKQYAAEAELAERIQLIDYIISHRQMQDRTAQEERKRMMDPLLTDITTIRTVAERVRNRRELESKTVPELRTLVKGELQSQWKPLPAHLQVRKNVLSLSGPEMRKAISFYGQAQLNAVLAKREEE